MAQQATRTLLLASLVFCAGLPVCRPASPVQCFTARVAAPDRRRFISAHCSLLHARGLETLRLFFFFYVMGVQVTKDQQTWRKEFNADSAAPTPAPKATPKPLASKAGVREHAEYLL